MLKLIRLEWKKNNIGKYFTKAVIVAVLLCLFLFALAYLGIANDPDTGVPDAAPGNGTISASIELLTRMNALQKILVSQMLAVWIFNFAALVLTRLLICSCILAGSCFMTSSFPIDYDMTGAGFYLQLLVKSAVIVTMGFIALFVGLAMKSSKATIVTSFLLIFLTQASIGDLTMANQAAFPLILTLISLAAAFFSVSRAETDDLM